LGSHLQGDSADEDVIVTTCNC